MDIRYLKRTLKRNPIGSWIIGLKDSINNWWLFQRRKKYIPKLAKSVGTGNLSIISSNCFAGRIMQDLKMEYNSPTLGLYFMFPDYIEFLQHLEYYLKEAKIEFVEHSKYSLGDERRMIRSITHHWYPIGLLGGKVEIHFLHYHTEEEAAQKWYRRANRVNLNNLLIIGMEQNLCTLQDIKEFNNLPFKRKIMFSTHNIKGIKSNCFVKEFAGLDSVGSPYESADVYYKYLTERIDITK